MRDVSPSPDEALDSPSSTPVPGQRRRKIYRILGVFFLTLAFLLAFYGTIAGVAWRDGEAQRSDALQTELADQLQTQLSLAESDIGNGNFQLALRRLEWVLQRQPSNELALNLQAEAEESLRQRLEPSPAPTAIPPTTLPTITPVATFDPTPDYNALAELMADEAWAEALAAIVAFQTTNPSFERRQTDIWLYEAHIAYGLELLQTEAIELGLFHLDQAEELGDLPLEVQDQRGWAELYLTGLAFYGVDWSAALYYFRQLCLAAPFYQNSCDRFQTALITYADQYVAAQDFCPAVPLYREALDYGSTTLLREKLNTAVTGCAEATPTPEPAPITDTVPISGTVPTQGDD
ncbi:MAG: hypothetical protein KDE59_20305 [Anaerolineales bacterium]|nr:hypothetical protein [Anaerolineales bacterium]